MQLDGLPQQTSAQRAGRRSLARSAQWQPSKIVRWGATARGMQHWAGGRADTGDIPEAAC